MLKIVLLAEENRTMIGKKLNDIFEALTGMGQDAVDNVTQTPEGLNKSTWDEVLKMGATVIMPVALVMVCIFVTLELYNVYCRSNGKLDLELVSATFFKLTLPIVLISRVYDIISLLFTSFTNTLIAMGGHIDASSFAADKGKIASVIAEGDALEGFFERIMFYLELFPLEILIRIAGIAVLVIAYGRLFEIMILWVFSPIPMASLLHSEFSGIGKDFLKRFIALTLQGGVIMVGIFIFNGLMKTMTIQAQSTGAVWAMLGFAILLVFVIIKSGNMANKIMGAS